MCQLFEEKLLSKNERLSRKFYQLFKEQTSTYCDDVKDFYSKKKYQNLFDSFAIEISRTNSNLFFQFK